MSEKTAETLPSAGAWNGEIDLLYRTHAPRLWRALLASSGNREVASDAVAEAFAQAIRRGKQIRSPERWLWKAVFRIAAGELQQRSQTVEPSDETPFRHVEPAWEVRDALLCLSPNQRASVVLHDYAGYPARDTARIIGSTPAAVRVHLSRGRTRLRELLAEGDAHV